MVVCDFLGDANDEVRSLLLIDADLLRLRLTGSTSSTDVDFLASCLVEENPKRFILPTESVPLLGSRERPRVDGEVSAEGFFVLLLLKVGILVSFDETAPLVVYDFSFSCSMSSFSSSGTIDLKEAIRRLCSCRSWSITDLKTLDSTFKVRAVTPAVYASAQSFSGWPA